ncbi:MAG: prepilin-type N-terminal cleavage/methylation domain-containing protein [Xanthomonadales bacterium]|nr:prepilin-type N-terminal cleavage/methylation domain-containing protein [Xanthomonadales bacterium]NNL94107.1 prepilin-type N-terminal cleavage/methylation domain-containing protein [Xanthomonadales bacterium]
MQLKQFGYISRHTPRGFTLIELMISMLIMIIVSFITIYLAAGVFQANSWSIHMIQLTQELRSSMQLISRDIRRSGYNDDALAGFLTTQSITSGITMGTLDANERADCLAVRYQDLDGNEKNAVYRLRVIAGVGRVSAHFGMTASCATAADDSGWVDVSDPQLTNISALQFEHQDQLTDIAENLASGNTVQVGLEQVSIIISGNLRSDTGTTRTVSNAVQLRNQYLRI